MERKERKLSHPYYKCKKCGAGYLGEKPKRCSCGSTKFKRQVWPHLKISLIKRIRKKFKSFFPARKEVSYEDRDN